MDFFDTGRRGGAPSLSRLLAEAAMARAALGACPSPIAILDAASPSRPVAYVNDAFQELFGIRGDEAVGKALGALIFRGDEALLHRMLAESAFSRPVRAWSRDGTPRPVQISLGALRDREGRVTHWVAGFADRSEAEKLQSELESIQDARRGPAAKAA